MNALKSIQTRHDQVLVTAAVFSALGAVALVLRLMTRRMLKVQLKADDWFIVAGFFFFLIVMIWEIWAFTIVNKAKDELDPWFIKFLKYEYILSVFYFACAGCTKMSILYFYRRIFAVKSFHRYAFIMLVVCTLWAIAGTIAEACMCIPADTFWSSHPRCYFYSTFWIAIMVIEIVIDVVILSLPIPQIVKLQLPTKKKVYVTGIFLLGSFVVITGPVRIGLGYRAHEFNIEIILDGVWMNIHLGTAIICACIPTYKPLVQSSVGSFRKLGSKYSSKLSSRYGTKYVSGDSSEAIHNRNLGNPPNFTDPSNYSSTTISPADRVHLHWSNKEGPHRSDLSA